MTATGPTLLVLGHVTCDQFADGERLGGALSFAARAAAVLGVDVAAVTAAPTDAPLLAPLRSQPGLALHVRPSPTITTFALDYSGPRRRLFQRAVATPLSIDDVPVEWRQARLAYVAPVAGECDGALVEALGAQTLVVAGLQGWLRRPADDGLIQPWIAPEMHSPPRGLRVGILSEEDHPDAETLATQLAATGVIVAITRGKRGATILVRDQRIEVPAAPAREVDPTGAGDVFGVVFGLGLLEGLPPPAAAERATRAAARVVEGPGLGTLRPSDR